jgi:uncharacterized protein
LFTAFTSVYSYYIHYQYRYDETGRCEKLTDDNLCSVYENRPLICDVDRLMALQKLTKDLYYAVNIQACNDMMEEDDLPLKYRI